MDVNANLLFPIIRHHSSKSHLLKKYRDLIGEYEFQKITGYPLAPTSTGLLLSYLKETDTSAYSRIDRILPVSNFIAYQLTGEKTSDRSIAASFGLWNHQEKTWWDEFLSDLDLEPNTLGKVVDGGTFIGTLNPRVSEKTGLRDDLPVYSGGHDYLCAALATNSFRPGQLFNIEGTFEIVATFHNSPVIKSIQDTTRSIIDIHVVPKVYSLMVERIGAGQIDWLKNLLYPSIGKTGKKSEDWDSIFTEIEKIADSPLRTEVFIPFIYGMLFPKFNDEIRGGFLGINQTSTRASIMRSAILSSCFESRRMVDYQREVNSGELCQLITVGGVTRSPLWMQQKANVIGLNIVVPKIDEPSALGAAICAGVGLGVYKDFNSISDVVDFNRSTTYEPDKAKTSSYAEYYQTVYLPVLRQAGMADAFIGTKQKGESDND
jgi:xylulokinase